MSMQYQTWKNRLAKVGEGLLGITYPLYRRLTLKFLLLGFIILVGLGLVLLTVNINHQRAAYQQAARANFQAFAEQQATRLNQEFHRMTRSLERLKQYVDILFQAAGENPDNQFELDLLRGLMAANLANQSFQYNNYFALEPEKAKAYFDEEAFLAVLYKDARLSGRKEFSQPDHMRFRLWKDTNYLQNEREYWYHVNKRDKDLHFVPVYFDKNYMKTEVFSLTRGLYENNDFKGVVGMDVLVDAFFPPLEALQVGRDGGVFLADPESGELLTSTLKRNEAGSGLLGAYERRQFNFYKSASPVGWQNVLQEPRDIREIQGENGDTYVISVQPLEIAPWVLGVYRNKSELQSATLVFPYLLASLLILLLTLLLALTFFRRLLQPLETLAGSLRQAKTQLPAPPVVLSGTPEVKLLGEEINEILMISNINSEQNEASSRELEEYRHKLLEQSKLIEERESRLSASRMEHQRLQQETRKLKTHLGLTQNKAKKLKLYAEKAVKEMRRARREAEYANRAKAQFLSNMSHELRTPMNAIIGYTEILQEDAEELGHYDFLPDLQKIHGASYHMLDLINNLFDLSKIESSRMDLYLETFDIAPMVQDVAATVQPLVEKQSNLLKLRLDNALGTMNADLTKVRQNLLNLLSNASKFTKQGTISLSANREKLGGQDWIIFEVSDQGIGMTPEQINKLFNAFNQFEGPSATRQFGGTGLGLVITKQFCRIMGGDISVASEFGKGSTFTIRLPADVGSVLATHRGGQNGGYAMDN